MLPALFSPSRYNSQSAFIFFTPPCFRNVTTADGCCQRRIIFSVALLGQPFRR